MPKLKLYSLTQSHLASMNTVTSSKNSPPHEFLEGRDAPPAHYSFKIQTFSLLSKASVEKYSSDKFEAGGYNWKLSIYPNGDKKRNGQDHISIFLALVETTTLPAGWEVNATFNFFVFDQFRDKYLSLSGGEVRRFHTMKTEWGIAKFINLETFTDPSKGFLVGDSCVFGAEIFILKQTRKGECLSMIEEAAISNLTWKIKSFSSLPLDRYESESFVAGDQRWKIRLYPRGIGEGKGNGISVFLHLDESTLPSDTKLLVKYTLRVVDKISAENFELKGDNQFGPSWLTWGSQRLMSLAKLYDPKKGFLVDDTCIIEAQVQVLGVVTTLS